MPPKKSYSLWVVVAAAAMSIAILARAASEAACAKEAIGRSTSWARFRAQPAHLRKTRSSYSSSSSDRFRKEVA